MNCLDLIEIKYTVRLYTCDCGDTFEPITVFASNADEAVVRAHNILNDYDLEGDDDEYPVYVVKSVVIDLDGKVSM